MEKVRIEIRMSLNEKKAITKAAEGLGFSLNEYIRRKLLDENDDLLEQDKFISPHPDKHNLINTSILYKTFYLVREILKNQYNDNIEAVMEAEDQALEYSRQERVKYGYKLIKSNDG